MTLDAFYRSKPSRCATATRDSGPSYLARHPPSLNPTGSRFVPCNEARPTRRPNHGESLLTSSRPTIEPKRGLKRRRQDIEFHEAKRVRVAPTLDATLTNEPAIPCHLPHFHPDAARPFRQKPHFMLWIAHMVLMYVVRVRAEDWPRPSLPPALVYTFVNDVQAVMSEYRLPERPGVREDLVVLSLWYLQKLSPKGFIHIDDLSTEDGLLAARRLLLLACNFASKWLFDFSSVRLEHFLPYYGKGFSRSAVFTLERSALEALGHSLYINPAQFNDFRASLVEWSSRVDILSPFYDVHRWMAKNLRKFSSNSGSEIMQERTGCRPCSNSIYTVHAALLTGLDDLLTNLLLSPFEPVASLADLTGYRQAMCGNLEQPSPPSLCCPTPSCSNAQNTGPYYYKPPRSQHVPSRPYPSIRQ